MAKKRKEKSFSSFVNNPIDFTLLITILLLLSIGLIMVLSASSATSLAESGNSYKYFKKQIIAAGVGIFLLVFLSRFDYRLYRRLKWPIYIGCFLLLLAVKFMGMSSRRS